MFIIIDIVSIFLNQSRACVSDEGLGCSPFPKTTMSEP
jgi:hypothetical protein